MGILIRMRGGSSKGGSGRRVENESAGPSSSESEARKELDELREQLVALERQNEELMRIRGGLETRLQQHADLCEKPPLGLPEFDPQEAVREVNLLRRRPPAAAEATDPPTIDFPPADARSATPVRQRTDGIPNPL